MYSYNVILTLDGTSVMVGRSKGADSALQVSANSFFHPRPRYALQIVSRSQSNVKF